MSRIYVATSWKNEHQPTIVLNLRHMGHQVYDFRNPDGLDGFAWTQLDPNWQLWTPRTYREQLLRNPRAAQGFMADHRAMLWADTCLMVLPCGNSAHIEAGHFAGMGKRLVIYIPDGNFQPDLMYLLANEICVEWNEVEKAFGGTPDARD